MVCKKNYKNKKAIGYFTLIGPIALVLFLYLYIAVSAPAAKIPKELDFKNTVTAVDLINAKIPAENFYKHEETRLNIERSKKEFSQTLGLTGSELMKRSESKEDELLGCKYNGVQLWYNEKNLDYNEFNKKLDTDTQENAEKETDENDPADSTEEENTKIIEKSFEYDDCLPSFTTDFKEKFELFIKDKLEEELTLGLKAQDIEQDPKVKLIYNPQTNMVETTIGTYYEESSKIARIYLDLNYSVSHPIGLFPDLLKTVSDIIPHIPDQIKENVPTCMKSEDKSELECIDYTINNLLEARNNRIEQEYLIKTSFMEVPGNEYYGLQIEVIKKSTQKQELNFGIILRDNIPYSLINFDLKTFEGIDNVIEIRIDEPRFASDVASYVVLYSYENFFDPSYEGYDEIITLLKNNQIPTNFKKTGFTDEFNNQYFYSDFQKDLEISLMTTSDKSFEKNADGKKIKKIKIFQIYDKEEGRYKLLENKPLYVFTFATDKNLNYYVDEIDNKAKSITPQTFLGPNPLPLNEDNYVTGEKDNYQNTLLFKIGNYTDTRFHHFDIYVTEDETGIVPYCEAAASTCHYFDGQSKLLSKEKVLFVVSSDEKEAKDDNLYAFINAAEFSNDLVLENKKKYNVYIVPMDSQRRGIMTTQKTQWNIKERVSSDISYFTLSSSNDNAILMPAKSSGITVVDKKGPDPLESIFVNGIKLNSNNFLYLQWNPAKVGEVSNLRGDITVTYTDAEPKTIPNTPIGLDGKTIAYEPNMASVVISRIIPYDSSGNAPTPLPSSSETHRATYP